MFGKAVETVCGTVRVEAVVTKSGKIVPCELVAVAIGVHRIPIPLVPTKSCVT
jgi:hypothetical protein